MWELKNSCHRALVHSQWSIVHGNAYLDEFEKIEPLNGNGKIDI